MDWQVVSLDINPIENLQERFYLKTEVLPILFLLSLIEFLKWLEQTAYKCDVKGEKWVAVNIWDVKFKF